jgi:hypothetical protein
MAQIPGDYNKTYPDSQETEVCKASVACAEGDMIKFILASGKITVAPADADGDLWDGVALHAAAIGEQLRFVTKGFVPKLACGSVTVLATSGIDSNGGTGADGTAGIATTARMRALTAAADNFCVAWIR